MSGHVAIFDVGKSNKKVVLFDEGMQQVAAEYQAFPALEEGAEHYEQTAAVTEWFLQTLRNLAAEHSIEAVGITTHGACAAGVDADGGLVEPVYAYTTDPGADFHADFHARCGTPRDLHRELASPSLAGSLLNLGVAAHYVQERHPEQWRQIRWFLPYPQYFAHVLTGKAAAEPTMLACHAYLYDFATGTYSRIPRELGLMDRLPDIVPSGQVIGGVSPAVAAATGLAAGTPVIAGVHDSNASLIPYLMLQDGRFILNSSGTWCVLMKPGSDRQLDDAQMDRNVFCNCSVFGDPVKTALVMAGQERQSWAEALSARQPGRDIYPDYDEVMHADLIADGERFVLPGVMPGTGPFPGSTSRFVAGDHQTPLAAIQAGQDAPDLYGDARDLALLDISLAVQTAAMIEHLGLDTDTTLFIEGGFRHNTAYQKVLSACLPDARIVLSDLQEATAFGTGLLTWAARRDCPLAGLREQVHIETRPVASTAFPGLDAYRSRFAELASA